MMIVAGSARCVRLVSCADRVLAASSGSSCAAIDSPARSDSPESRSRRVASRPRSASCPDAASVPLASSTSAPRANARSASASTPTQDHEVVRVAHHLEPRCGHQVVQRVEIDVRQQRTDHRSLRRSRLGRPRAPALSITSCLQERFEQASTRPSATFSATRCQQPVVRDRVEVAFQIGIHHPRVSCLRAAGPPGAARPCTLARAETRSCARRSPARRSAPARSATPSAPPGRAPSGSPAAVAPCSPAWESRPAEPPAADSSRRAAARPACRGSLPGRLRTSRPSRDPLPPLRSLALHLRASRLQVRQRVDLVDQTEPTASFHPSFEGRQHAVGPDRRFHPRPAGADLSCLFSLAALAPVLLPVCLSSRLHLPASLRSTPVTALHRYYGRSDSCPAALRLLARMNTGLHPGQVSLIHAHILPDHSVSNHPVAPRRRFLTLPLSATASHVAECLGFAIALQARRACPAESSSSSYGLVVHLLLLPTPPRGDAVTVGYRPESVCLKRTCTSLDGRASRRTRSPRFARDG